jgi:hypothetical protein
MELTIVNSAWSKWGVTNKHPVFSKIVFIDCDTSEEAMEILQQLNGQPYEVINAFQRTRERLG